MEAYMLPCLMLKYTGIPCPGCGGQRSVLHLLHGEFGEALMIYPAIYPLLIVGMLMIANFFAPMKTLGNLVSLFSLLSVFTILVHYITELNAIFHFI